MFKCGFDERYNMNIQVNLSKINLKMYTETATTHRAIVIGGPYLGLTNEKLFLGGMVMKNV